MILKGPPLAAYRDSWTQLLDRWALLAPERTFLAERDGQGWRRMSYQEFQQEAKGRAARLSRQECIELRLPNGIEHALLLFGAMYAGVPVIVCGPDAPSWPGSVPEGVAKVMFTSGSGGEPKGVLTTQRMLCANQAMLNAALRPMLSRPPVVCDWLPWHHVYGGSHNLGFVLAQGGTLYVDDGAPTPAGLGRMVENLEAVRPTVLFGVPRSLSLLLPALSEGVQQGLEVVFSAGAALVEPAQGLPLVGGYGATETAPFAMFTGRGIPVAGFVGWPAAGVELQLLELGDGHYEACFRGPNVTPGYWNDPERTAAAIDAEGFWHSGDVLRFLDAARPELGLCFVARLGEAFKLSSGTWVRAQSLRRRLLEALGRLAEDVILVGENQPELGVVLVLLPGVEQDAALAALRGFAVREQGTSRRIRKGWLLATDEVPRTVKGGLMRQALEEMLRGREPQFTLEG